MARVALSRQHGRASSAPPSACVLSFAVGRGGGVAKATLLLCQALTDLGCAVTLFVTVRPEDAERREVVSRGISLVEPWIKRGWRWQIPQRVLTLQLYLRTRRSPPSFIHVMGLSLEADLLLRLPRPGSVYAWETTEGSPASSFHYPRIAARLHRAEAVLVPSRAVADNVRRSYSYSGPLKILPFWAEPAPAQAAHDAHRTRNFLYVGRLDEDKGFAYLFEAFSRVRAACPDATLTIRGRGDRERVRSLAGTTPGIDIGGYIDAAEYERALAHCDAVILASLHEGYPLSLLEACARGRPVIATAVGSIPEVFGGRPCALIVPPRDPDALADAMVLLLAESDASYRLRCQDARTLFDEVSSPERIRERVREVYAL